MNVSVIPEDDEPAREGDTPSTGGGQQPTCVILREAREAAGYSVADVAQLLRIQRQYLTAIEEGRYSDLPGSVYAIGFVRTYSDFLNLEADDVVRNFKNEAEDLSRPTDYVFPVTPTEARVPGFAVLVIGVLLAALAYSAWYLAAGDSASVADRVTDVPDRVSDLASRSAAPNAPSAVPFSSSIVEPMSSPEVASPSPDVAPAIEPAQEPAIETATAPVATPAPSARETSSAGQSVVSEPTPPIVDRQAPPTAEPPVTVAAADPDPALPKTTVLPAPAPPATAAEPSRFAQQPPPRFAPLPEATPAPAVAPLEERDVGARTVIAPQFAESSPPPPPPAAQARRPRVYGLGNADARVLIRATEMSWVQITDDQGNLVMTQVLEPGDTYRVPGGDGLILASGNAGGLVVEVDGRILPPLGLRGTVVRNVSLNPDSLSVRAGN